MAEAIHDAEFGDFPEVAPAAPEVSVRAPEQLPPRPLVVLEQQIVDRLAERPSVDIHDVGHIDIPRVARTVGRVLAEHVDALIDDPSMLPAGAPRPHKVVGQLEFGINELLRQGAADIDNSDIHRHRQAEDVLGAYTEVALNFAQEAFFPEINLAKNLGNKWRTESHTGAAHSAGLLVASYGLRVATVRRSNHNVRPNPKRHSIHYLYNPDEDWED